MAKAKHKNSTVKMSPIKLVAIILIFVIISGAGVFLYLNWNEISKLAQPKEDSSQTKEQLCNEDNTTCFAAHLKDCSSSFLTVNISGSSITAMAVIKGKQNYTIGNLTQEVCGINIAPMTTCTYLIPMTDLQIVPTKDSYTMLIYLISLKVNTNC